MIWRLPPTLALLALLSGGPAFGAVADPRVRTLQYDPDQVYRIVGVVRSATQIVFSSTETIEHVALGDSATWEAAPQDQVLFLKPLVTGRPTNLIVTTRLGSLQRHYAFELVTRSGSIGRSTAETYFQVRFSYPADQRAELDRALAAETAALEQQVLQLKLDRAVLEGPRNLSYEVQGVLTTWMPGDETIELAQLASTTDFVFIAHNAAFEKAIWRNIMMPVFGFPNIPDPRKPQKSAIFRHLDPPSCAR